MRSEQKTPQESNPWRPMRRPIDLKHVGKLIEELCECGIVASRCVIQGVDECEPITGKSNRAWLEDEIADVLANIKLVENHFGLNVKHIRARAERKMLLLRSWHSALEEEDYQ